jgi:hypothetical protein
MYRESGQICIFSGAVDMSLLTVVAVAACVLIAAYFTYGRFLSRFLSLDPHRPTPVLVRALPRHLAARRGQ